MPISIPEINREANSVFFQLHFESSDQRSVLSIDRAHAAEMVVMLRHREQALSRYVSATQYIFQERNDIVPAFWPAERDDQHGIVFRRAIQSARTAIGSKGMGSSAAKLTSSILRWPGDYSKHRLASDNFQFYRNVPTCGVRIRADLFVCFLG